ncbi:unnamed protein product, partial [Nesidiocoris tenuis]
GEVPRFQRFDYGRESQLGSGENCGYGGKCRRLSECPTAQADLRAGRTPVICSFDALLPIVCCHPEAAPDLESDWATTSKRPANRPTTGRPSGRTVSQRSEFLKIDDSSDLFLIFFNTSKIRRFLKLPDCL